MNRMRLSKNKFCAGVQCLKRLYLQAHQPEPEGKQQKLMRHSDIRTTMNIYGDAATEDMRQAHNKIVGLALRTV